ncbi:MAG: hypothetical protein CM1200mP3_05990 [Chloroflexota bacterium]|nr:MAG: hypothetical protein CM1200mP3_05990 [Chloroflexota bacterium]
MFVTGYSDTRDRAKKPIVKKIYAQMALGFRGTPAMEAADCSWYFAFALVLPVFVSVHSIVSWDFAV